MSFLLGKLAWLVIRPSNFLLLLALAGLLAGRRPAGRLLLALSVGTMALVTVLPVGLAVMRPLEERFAAPDGYPETVDGIVVLGGGIDLGTSASRGQPVLKEPAERFAALTELARRYPGARVVFTGGSGEIGPAATSEAAVMRDYVRRQGLDPGRVAFESESRNTSENARLTAELVRPQPGERWLLVTSAGHMPRAVGAFRAAGWDPVPWPVDYRTTASHELIQPVSLATRLSQLDDAAHEWAGLLYYRLLGHSDVLLPAPAATASSLAAGGGGS
ncbi:YdcF family protein [Geminicoccaceae bacterium 1502E]|nr:YdcF family protein [Geminicoccaceae bacterium 1502E]